MQKTSYSVLFFVEYQVMYSFFLTWKMSYFQAVFTPNYKFFKKGIRNRLKPVETYKLSPWRLKSILCAGNVKTRGVWVFDSKCRIVFIKFFIIFTQKFIQNLKCMEFFFFCHKSIRFFCLIFNFCKKGTSKSLKPVEWYKLSSLGLKSILCSGNAISWHLNVISWKLMLCVCWKAE